MRPRALACIFALRRFRRFQRRETLVSFDCRWLTPASFLLRYCTVALASRLLMSDAHC